MLPCYLVYAHIGQQLATHACPNLHHQRWLDSYASEEFARWVAEILAVADQTGASLDDMQRARALTHQRTSARYELMLWDGEFRGHGWPL